MSGPITVRCPQCQAKLKFKNQRNLARKKVSCPKCGKGISIGDGQRKKSAPDEFGGGQFPPRTKARPQNGSKRPSERFDDDFGRKLVLLGGGAFVAVAVLVVGLLFWPRGGDTPDPRNEGRADAVAEAGLASPSPDAADETGDDSRFAYLPPDAEFIASLRVNSLWNSPVVQSWLDGMPMAPLEQIQQELRLEPGDIDEVLVGLAGMSEATEDVPPMRHIFPLATGRFSLALRANKNLEMERLLDVAKNHLPPGQELESVEHTGATYYRIPLLPAPEPGQVNAELNEAASAIVAAAFLADEKTLVVCNEQQVRSLIADGAETGPRPELDVIDQDWHLLLIFAPEDASFFTPDETESAVTLPPFAEALRGMALGLSMDEGIGLALRGRFTDEEAAESGVPELETLISSAREQVSAMREEGAPEPLAALWTLAANVLEETAVSRTGRIVRVSGAIGESDVDALQQLPAVLATLPLGNFGATAGGPEASGLQETTDSPSQTMPSERTADASAPPAEDVEEGLQKKLSLSFEEPFGLFPPEDANPLFATIELTGKAAADATHYGYIELTTATVNDDRPLQQVESPFSINDPSEQFVEIDRNMMFAGQFEKPKATIRMHLMLQQPPSGAEQVQVLEGSLQLMTGGERKEITIEGVKRLVGESLSDPALSEADLVMQVIDPSQARVTPADAEPEQMVSLVIQGPETSILDINLVDGQGNEIETQAIWSGDASEEHPLQYTLQAEEPLPDDAALRLSLAVGQQRVRVPFRFEDIPLPDEEEGTTTKLAVDSNDSPPAMSSSETPSPPAGGGESQPRFRLRVRGHTQGVNAVAYSPDGKDVASAGERGKIKIWDLESVNVRADCDGHEGPARTVAFSPDGRLLATGGNDGKIRLWNARNGEQVRILDGHWHNVLDVEFSPDGSQLATAGRDWTARLWDVETGRELGTLKGHVGWVHAVAFSPDGRRLASAAPRPEARDNGGEVIVWDLQTEVDDRITYGKHKNVEIVSRKVETKLTGHPRGAECVAFLPDGARLVSASRLDNTIRVWSLSTGEQVTQWDAARGPLAVSPEGKYVTHGTDTGEVQLRETATGTVLASWEGHEGEVTSLAFSPDGASLATAGADNDVRVWTLPSADSSGPSRR